MYHKVPCDMFLIVESDDNKALELDVWVKSQKNDFDDFSRHEIIIKVSVDNIYCIFPTYLSSQSFEPIDWIQPIGLSD